MADARQVAELESALNKARLSHALGQGSGAHRTEIIRQEATSLLDYLKKSDDTNRVMLSSFSGKSKEILNVITSTTQKMVGATSKEARNLSKQLKHLEGLSSNLNRQEQKVINERIKNIRGTMGGGVGGAAGSALGNVIGDRLSKFTPINLLKSLPGPASAIGNFLGDFQQERNQLNISNLENSLQVAGAAASAGGGGGGILGGGGDTPTGIAGGGVVGILSDISRTLDQVGIALNDALNGLGLEELVEAGTERGSIYTHDTHVTDELKESNTLLSKMVKLLTRDKLQGIEDKRELGKLAGMGSAGTQGMFPFMTDPSGSNPNSPGAIKNFLDQAAGFVMGNPLATLGIAPLFTRRGRNLYANTIRKSFGRQSRPFGGGRPGGGTRTRSKGMRVIQGVLGLAGLGGVGYAAGSSLMGTAGGGGAGDMTIPVSGDGQIFGAFFDMYMNGEIDQHQMQNAIFMATGRDPEEIYHHDIRPVAEANEMMHHMNKVGISTPLIYDEGGNPVGFSHNVSGSPFNEQGFVGDMIGMETNAGMEEGLARTGQAGARMRTQARANNFIGPPTAPTKIPSGVKWMRKALRLPILDGVFEGFFTTFDIQSIAADPTLTPAEKKEMIGQRFMSAFGGVMGGTTGAGIAAAMAPLFAMIPGPGWVAAVASLVAAGGLWMGGDAAGRYLSDVIGKHVIGGENMGALGEMVYDFFGGDVNTLNGGLGGGMGIGGFQSSIGTESADAYSTLSNPKFGSTRYPMATPMSANNASAQALADIMFRNQSGAGGLSYDEFMSPVMMNKLTPLGEPVGGGDTTIIHQSGGETPVYIMDTGGSVNDPYIPGVP